MTKDYNQIMKDMIRYIKSAIRQSYTEYSESYSEFDLISGAYFVAKTLVESDMQTKIVSDNMHQMMLKSGYEFIHRYGIRSMSLIYEGEHCIVVFSRSIISDQMMIVSIRLVEKIKGEVRLKTIERATDTARF